MRARRRRRAAVAWRQVRRATAPRRAAPREAAPPPRQGAAQRGAAQAQQVAQLLVVRQLLELQQARCGHGGISIALTRCAAVRGRRRRRAAQASALTYSSAKNLELEMSYATRRALRRTCVGRGSTQTSPQMRGASRGASTDERRTRGTTTGAARTTGRRRPHTDDDDWGGDWGGGDDWKAHAAVARAVRGSSSAPRAHALPDARGARRPSRAAASPGCGCR